MSIVPAHLRGTAIRLFAASFVTLVQELALIRWLPGQVRILAYFSNIVLLSAFVGLGIGCLLDGRRLRRGFWPASLLLLTAAAWAASRIAFTQEAASEYLWLLYVDLPRTAPIVEGIRIPILAFFVLTALTFVPLGHFIAGRLREFQEGGSALAGYAVDLAGSLAGVIVFTAFSYSGAFPVVWFSVALLAGLAMFPGDRRALAVQAAGAVAILLVVAATERAQVYSPYYALDVVQGRYGTLEVRANGSLHQVAMPLATSQRMTQGLELSKIGYHLPYRLLKRNPGRVLVLGAGTGNDVAVALSEGATRVDAVEIDPRILDLGRQLHPHRPYDSPRVRTFNRDARAYLNDTSEKYDLVVFGTLDSMTRLSALSNVRLDNFVYTVECFRAARSRLAPGGAIALYFRSQRPYIEEHIGAALVAATGERPVVVRTNYGMFNRLFLIGPGFKHLSPGPPLTEAEAQAITSSTDVPTDDWPYLYLAGRHVSGFYLSLIAAILALSTAAVFAVSPAMRRSARTGVDPEMFLFGAAFLIIETKLVTEMNLVWGATWLTSAVVFGSILLMILAGTLVVQRWPIPWRVSSTALIATLLVTWLLPARELAGRAFSTRLVLSILFIGVPVFFASVCFAILFREREHAAAAFGWNMLGAVAGGLAEFSSMVIGLKATTLLAVAAYLVAMLLRERSIKVVSAAEGVVPASG